MEAGTQGQSSNSPRGVPRSALFALAALLWFAVILQAALTLALSRSRGASAVQALWVFAGYFTILTNLLAAVALAAPAIAPRSALGRLSARPGPITAVTAYMLLVGIAYNLLLRGQWNPQGWQLVADNLLHCADPLAFAVYWWFAGRSRGLSFTAIGAWLLYPFGYLVYAVARGLSGDFYAYPFIDVGQFGIARVAINAGVIGLGFCVLAASLIFLGRRSSP